MLRDSTVNFSTYTDDRYINGSNGSNGSKQASAWLLATEGPQVRRLPLCFLALLVQKYKF
jgi:hypothetical protein